MPRPWVTRLHRIAALAAVVLACAAAEATAGPSAYVTNTLSADVSQYDASGGRLVALTPPTFTTGSRPLALAPSPDGRFVYVSLSEPAAASTLAVRADGTLALAGSAPVPPGAIAGDVVVSPDGRSVFVLDTAGNGAVLQFSVAASGLLVPKTPPAVATTPAPERAAIAPDGSSLYMTSAFERGVVRHAVGAGGALGPRSAAVPSGDQPVGIALSPDGRSAYVADPVGLVGIPGLISLFDVGPAGALVPKVPASIPAGSHPFDLVVSPDGRNLYATDSDAPGGVLQFAVGAGGALTPLSPAEVPAGAFPLGLAVSADGRNVYAASSGADSVSQYARGADGRLTPLSPATVPAGANPIEVAVTPARPEPATKDDCKDGGWRALGFRNQGQCVAAVNHPR